MDTKTFALIAALSANSTGKHDQHKLISSMLGESDVLDPKQQLLLEYLQQDQEESEVEEDNYGDEFEVEELPEFKFDERKNRALSDQAREKFRQKFLEMQVELKELRQRNEVFALALGACHCWGYEETCAECHGQGSSGYYHCDPQLFEQFIAPALSAQQLEREIGPAEQVESNSIGTSNVNTKGDIS